MTVGMTETQLWDALVGLYNFHHSGAGYRYSEDAARSAGNDETLGERAMQQLRAMTTRDQRRFITRWFRDAFLSDEALDRGYNLEDASHFWKWYTFEVCRISMRSLLARP